jgi:hypothetical protein
MSFGREEMKESRQSSIFDLVRDEPPSVKRLFKLAYDQDPERLRTKLRPQQIIPEQQV